MRSFSTTVLILVISNASGRAIGRRESTEILFRLDLIRGS